MLEELRKTVEPHSVCDLQLRQSLANAYINRGNVRQTATAYGPAMAIADHNQAIALFASRSDWDSPLRKPPANAYINRGPAKYAAAGDAAMVIGDYDRAIALLEAPGRVHEPREARDPSVRNDLALAYMNRGSAKLSIGDQGPVSALEDYNRAIVLMEALRGELEPLGGWDVVFRSALASAYINRGNVKQVAEGYGAATALADCDRAIALRDELRQAAELSGRWDPSLRNDLATAYMSRGDARVFIVDHGPLGAINDYDRAIALMEAVRNELEPHGAWHPVFRNALASAYTSRGNLKQAAVTYGPGTALADYDRAITFREVLRQVLERRGIWDPPLQKALADAYSQARRREACRRAGQRGRHWRLRPGDGPAGRTPTRSRIGQRP